MKTICLAAVAAATVLAAALPAAAVASGDSPVGKAVQLLAGLQASIADEGAQAQKLYEEHADFCEDRARDLQNQVKVASEQAGQLRAAIAQGDSTIGRLSTKLDGLSEDIASNEADRKAATAIRDKEAKDFLTHELELTETCDMVSRAVRVVEREMEGESSLAQLTGTRGTVQALQSLVQASALSTLDAEKIAALAQQAQSPEANAYESKSGSLVETLQNMLEKAEALLEQARKEETSNRHNFELLKQSLTDEIREANKQRAEAKKGRSAAEEAKASDEGDLTATTKDLNADSTTLQKLRQDCMTKAQDYEAELRSRSEELEALAAAKKAIQDNTAGAASISYGSGKSFLQVASSNAMPAHLRVARMVRELAREQHSTELAQLASRLGAASHGGSRDPLAKVAGLIEDMIAKLEEQANSETTEKAYCDKELGESKVKEDDKADEVEKLSTQIDKVTARSAQLKQEVATLQKELASVMEAQAEMDKLRLEEKTAYKKNKADLDKGLDGVKLALRVLSEYYSAGGKAHDSEGGAGSGIIGLLEVVEGDFTKSLAEMSATEESAEANYEKETKANQVDKAAKDQDVKYKSAEATRMDGTASEANADRGSVQAELDAVQEYLAQIRKRCTAAAETYEERKARFEAELGGLNQALQVLSGETALVQMGATHHVLRGASRRQAVLRGA